MKMTAKSSQEDDDSWIEDEIRRELEKLTIDLEAVDDADVEEETELNENDSLQKEFSDVVLPALDDYISKFNHQMAMVELELQECDEVLREVDIVSARQPQNNAFLEALAAEAGTDVHSLKLKILRELEEEEKAEKNWDDVTESSCNVENVIAADATDHDGLQLEVSTPDFKGFDPANEIETPMTKEVNEDGIETLLDSASILPAAAHETEALSCEVLEKQFRLQLKELARVHQQKELKRQQVEQSLKEKDNLLVKELADERQKRLLKIEEEASQLNEEKQTREAKFNEEKETISKQLEKSMKESEVQLKHLTDRINEQREALKQMTEEKNLQQEKQRMISATKIQAHFRGFRIRKIYGAKVQEKIKEVKDVRMNERLKVIEERIRMNEEKKKEEEKKKKEEEERKKRLEEEEKRRIEEEKQRKEEETKRKKEEERLRKEQERRAKEEAKQQKKEEERKRKEQEKLKKDEEKRKKEEEKQRKEEEERKKKEKERQKKEEEERKKAEEGLRKAEEEKRKEEESLKKEEEWRKIEDKRIKDSQELKRQELESLHNNKQQTKTEKENVELEQRVIATAIGTKEQNGEEKKPEATDSRNTNENYKREQIRTTPVAEDLKLMTSQKPGQAIEESNQKLVEQKSDANPVTNRGLRNATESLPKTSRLTEAKQLPLTVQRNKEDKDQNKTCDIQENRSKNIEARRLAWTKDNQSWSKSVSRQRSKKVVPSQNSLRVPSSAKNLPALAENVILSSSKSAKLKQVTSIELHDISACSLKTLSQCINLKYLVMNNCNLIATEGVEQITGLQYVDLKNNKLEMMNFCDLVNLTYLDVSKNSLRSLMGLMGCSSLQHLNISKNRITRISGLESLDCLHTLTASDNQLISTKGLANLISIQVLDLSNNHLSTVDDLEHLGMIRTLDLRGNDFITVPPLSNQVLLCDLLLDRNSLSSLTSLPLAWLPSLRNLGLSENRLTSLVDLQFCPCLQSIDLSNNLITDIERVLVGLSSCRELESISVTGNPLVEDTNYRKTLLSKIKSLRYLNDEKQTDCAFMPYVEPDSWLAKCRSYIDGFRHLRADYVKSLENAHNSLSDIYDTHVRYFGSSHQMAKEQRFFHEYGGKLLPQPPVTPKLLACNELNSLPFEKPCSVQEASAAQAINMKAKFEQVLLCASSSKTMQAGTKTGSDEIELHSKPKTTDEGFSSQQSRNKNIPVFDNPEPSNSDFGKSLATKNVGLSSQEVKASSTFCRPSPETGSITQSPQQPKLGSTVQAANVRKERNSTKLRIRDVGYLDKAATKIQSLWRGYSFRKRLQHVLNDAHLMDIAGDFDFADFNIEALMPNELWFERDTVLPPTPRNVNNNHIPVGMNMYANNRIPADFQSSTPDMELPPVPKQAWRSSATPSPLGELVPPRGHWLCPPGKPPLPPSSRLSNLSDAHSNTSAGHSVRQEKIMEEWDFKNPRTAELFLQRAKKMEQLGRKKKLAELDPIKRLAVMRRLEEMNKVPSAALSYKRERPPPRKEYFKALKEQEEQREVEVQKDRHQKAEYTFEWLHTQVQHCNSPFVLKRGSSEGSLPQISPASAGGKVTAFMCSPSSLKLQSADGASAANGSVKQRRLSFNSDKLPLLAVNSNPSSAGPTREMSWRRSEVNQSIGWGGGKKRAHQRR